MTETTKEQSKEIAAIPPEAGAPVMAFIPKTPEEIKWEIGMIVGAGLVPDCYLDQRKQPDQKKLAIGILKGLEVGVPPLAAINNIAIINGRPSVWGDLGVALVQRQNVVAKISHKEVGEIPDEGASPADYPDSYGIEYSMARKGTEGAYTYTFTVGMAKKARLWMNTKKAPWMMYPKRMLFNRARAYVLRDGFADCLNGLAIREEMEDLPSTETEQKADTSFLDDDVPNTDERDEQTIENVDDDGWPGPDVPLPANEEQAHETAS